MTQVARCNYFAPQTTTWHRWPAQKYSLQVFVTSWQVRKWEQENWSVIPIDTMNINIICTYCPYTDVGVFYPVHAVRQHHKNAVKQTENSLRKAKNIKINILEEKETRGHYKKSSISIIINYACVTSLSLARFSPGTVSWCLSMMKTWHLSFQGLSIFFLLQWYENRGLKKYHWWVRS
jgi:hypothetical protein